MHVFIFIKCIQNTQFVHSDAVMYVQKKEVGISKQKTNAFRYDISKHLRANKIQVLTTYNR